MEYNLEKWKSIGALEGIPENRHENAVNAFNTTIKFIVDENTTLNNESNNFEIMPLILIQRIFREIDINVNQTLNTIKEFKIFKHPELSDSFPFFTTEMIMNESCRLFAEIKINQYKNETNN